MNRDVILAQLQWHLERCQAVLAMWEGGSAATGRTDDYSDVDIGVLYTPGAREIVWKVVDRAVDKMGGINIRWQPPLSGPAGDRVSAKRVFRMINAKHWLLLDIRVFPINSADLHNDPARDGTLVIIFDRSDGRMPPVSTNEHANGRRIAAALHQNLTRWQIYYGWFRKELLRNNNVDAFMAYLQFTVFTLVTVLNIRYRPSRWDFGLRFLKHDLPPDIVKIVEGLCYVPSAAALEERLADADGLMQKILNELYDRGVVPVDPSRMDIAPWLASRGAGYRQD